MTPAGMTRNEKTALLLTAAILLCIAILPSPRTFFSRNNPVVPELPAVDSTLLVRTSGYIGANGVVSVYDSLIRVHAKAYGWDWRMLAAVIYHESRFDTSAVSRKGATGLMQMMPATAERFGVANTSDPDSCILAGMRYLKFLEKTFAGTADNHTEKYKYALAAYNAGEGRIRDCVNYAIYRGVNPSYWDNVTKIIPEMCDSSLVGLDFIVCGPFKGKETIRYVDSVLDIYNKFCTICPEGTTPSER